MQVIVMLDVVGSGFALLLKANQCYPPSQLHRTELIPFGKVFELPRCFASLLFSAGREIKDGSEELQGSFLNHQSGYNIFRMLPSVFRGILLPLPHWNIPPLRVASQLSLTYNLGSYRRLASVSFLLLPSIDLAS
jgi:hypothetical protein